MTHFNAFAMISCLALSLWAAENLQAEPWEVLNTSTHPTLPGDEIQFLRPSESGDLWIGTLTGIAKYSKETFAPLKNAKGEKIGLQAWCAHEDAQGNTWVGHGNGVARISPDGAFTNMLAGRTVAPIVPVGDQLWVIAKERGTEANKLVVYADGEWKTKDEIKQQVVDLFVDSRSHVWLTLDGNGVLEIDPAKGIEEAIPHLEGFNVTTVFEDGRHRIWCGLWSRGIAINDGTGWETHLTNLKDSAILNIVQDKNSNMWVATSANGLWWQPFNKQTWQNELADEGAINLLVTTTDGRVWISSQMVGGLRYRKDDKWVVSLDSPLPIRCLTETPDNYWAGGVLDGLHRLPLKK